jgi:mannose-6-phosphate isomerase-like protein (cupin superfamily)
MDKARVEFEHLDWQVGSPGVRFKAAARDDKQLRLVEIDPAFEQDWCVTGHVGYILKGKLEIEFNHGIKEFRAGDGLLIPAGEAERHKPRAMGSVVQLVLVEDV